MSRLIAALAATLFAGFAGTAVAARDLPPGTIVRIATEGAYKPWNFRAADGSLAGFEIDLTHLLCADLALQCTIRTERWSRMLPQLEAGAFDAVFAGMSITPDRRARAVFSTPYAATPAVFVSPRLVPGDPVDTITLPEIDAGEQAALVTLRKTFLNGIVGVQAGTTHETFLRDYFEGYVQVRTYTTQAALDADVASGRLAAMLVSLGYAVPLERPPGGAGMRIAGPRLTGGPFGEGIGAAFRKADDALAGAFSGAIARRIADGTVRDLAVRWFGFDVSAQP